MRNDLKGRYRLDVREGRYWSFRGTTDSRELAIKQAESWEIIGADVHVRDEETEKLIFCIKN